LPLERTDRIELLDTLNGAVSQQELAGNLRDIQRANRYFGGRRAILSVLRPILRERAHCTEEPVTILDLATGSADIPLALVHEGARHDWNIQITATDLQPQVLALARAAERPGSIQIEAGDARDLSYPDGAFDIVTLSLALHHFEPPDALLVLAEMRRVARQMMIVNDLERSSSGLAGAWLFSRLLTRNRLTRHDAPLSVRRAYSSAEALALARSAHWKDARVRPVVPFRFVLTGSP
jgi:ubiquinone/menaquinone biosynthesis C-methylase UbiE